MYRSPLRASQGQKNEGAWIGGALDPYPNLFIELCFGLFFDGLIFGLFCTLRLFWARFSFSRKAVALFPKVSELYHHDIKIQNEVGSHKKKWIRNEKLLPFSSLHPSGRKSQANARMSLRAFHYLLFPFLTKSVQASVSMPLGNNSKN